MKTRLQNSDCPAKPDWIRVPAPTGKKVAFIRELKNKKHLNTVCESALCPNIAKCWDAGQATFMILGNGCTRNCSFCAVKEKPQRIDPKEPRRVAEAVSAMGLKHAEITSVTRDDLPDGGASYFADTISSIRKQCPKTSVEILIPDFKGSRKAIARVANAVPDILGHNIETVSRLYPKVRPGAVFSRSLRLLEIIKTHRPSMITKSGLMVGLGESESEVLDVFGALRSVDVDILTIGQYLRPGPGQLPVDRYYDPDEFTMLKHRAEEMGFSWVESGPLVRSSYLAEKQADYFLKRNKD
jgi:lipoic acid synthetase